jgi:uncharacterized protein (TIGR00730 family)
MGRIMSQIRRVCVYCGSSPGNDPDFVAAATRLGAILADNGVGIIYGGGTTGLMGALATAALSRGGDVVGVIPSFLRNRERMLKDASELIVTDDMHERKRIMFERSDAFVALPGGLGTLEELTEQLTWSQLGRHRKPILLANIDSFWDPLLALIAHMRELAFVREGLEVDLLTADRVEDILPRLRQAAKTVQPEPEIAPARL